MASFPPPSPYAVAASCHRREIWDPACPRSFHGSSTPTARLHLEPPVQFLRHPETESDPFQGSRCRRVILDGEHRGEHLLRQ